MDADPSKTLLVIQPSVKLPKGALRAMEEAGFVVVRGDPSQFTVVSNTPPMSNLATITLRAALHAIGTHAANNDPATGNGVRSLFGRSLARELGYGNVVALK